MFRSRQTQTELVCCGSWKQSRHGATTAAVDQRGPGEALAETPQRFFKQAPKVPSTIPEKLMLVTGRPCDSFLLEKKTRAPTDEHNDLSSRVYSSTRMPGR